MNNKPPKPTENITITIIPHPETNGFQWNLQNPEQYEYPGIIAALEIIIEKLQESDITKDDINTPASDKNISPFQG